MDLTPGDRARTHRRLDEILTERVETFLSEQQRLDVVFTAAQLADAIGIARFRERDAHLLLVAMMGQGRVHHDWGGWHAGPGRQPR